MPSVEDIVELAQNLESSPVAVVAQRCVKIRNRNAACMRCVAVCPVDDVISIERNEFGFDAARCVGCGACTTVCPTEALVALQPSDADFAETLARTCLHVSDGSACIACDRAVAAAQGAADPRTYASMPCLARVDVSALVSLAAHGIETVSLVDGDCTTCRFRSTDEKVTQPVREEFDRLVRAWDIDVTVERLHALPESRLAEDSRVAYATARRNFFTGARDQVKDVGLKTAISKLGLHEKQTLRDMLKVGSGRMPQFTPPRHAALLDDLDAAGTPGGGTLETRLWGRVVIDAGACNGCAMCATFCPTGALTKADEEAEDGTTVAVLEFRVADCVGCKLCADACFRKCLSVRYEVGTSDLFDLEPETVWMSTPIGGEAGAAKR